MQMKRIVAGLFLLASIAGTAMADDCANAGHGTSLTTTALTALLNPGGGVYACYPAGGAPQNNETLGAPTGTHFQEYHKGGSTVQDEGTFQIHNLSGGGAVSYLYNSGGTFSYRVCSDNVGNHYAFVPSGTSAALPSRVGIGTSPNSSACP
jgi:hypothetical protein